MLDSILARTSLPNLHPAVIHFPIALLSLAVGLDVLALLLRRPAWLDRAIAGLFLLGALAAGAAFLTGQMAEDGLRNLPPAMEPFIARHADAARWTAITFAILGVVRAALAWRRRHEAVLRGGPLWIASIVGSVGGLALLVTTADRGGALVFRHGIAVTQPAAFAPTAVRSEEALPAADAQPGFTVQPDGSLVWRSSVTDTAGLPGILRPVDEASRLAVRPAPRPPGGGLALEVRGMALLAFPGSFTDVRLELRVDATAFRGTFGLAHHLRGPDRVGLFHIFTNGQARLEEIDGSGRRTLDSGAYDPAPGPMEMAFNASGQHFKGMVNGAVVCHGHLDPGGPGGLGLVMDGAGTLTLLEIRVVPAADVPGGRH
jgi:uncharacterized membrane protein